MQGSTLKRCYCKDNATGALLGARCPRIKRSEHGTWGYAVRLETTRGNEQVKRFGFTSKDEAETKISEIKKLVEIGETSDLQKKIGSLIKEATARGGELPTIDGVRRRVNAGVALDKSITVGEWLDNWLNGKRDIKKTTRNGYESNIRVYLKPHLGHLPLDKLQISQIDAMFDRIQEADDELTELRERASRGEEVDFNRRQRITSAATRQRIRATLRSSLSAAIKRELIASNPAKHVSLASGKRPKALVWTRARTENWWAGYSRAISQLDERARKSVVRQFKLWKETPRPSKVMVWTPEQTGAFLDDVTSDRLSPCLHLIVFSGLRRGEACGVSWPDIDLDDGVLHVSWQLVLHGWEVAGDTPKADSVRDIPLDPVTIAVLRWWRGQQDRERDGWDPAWTDSVRVFTREDGSNIHPSFLSYRFQRLAFAAQLPPIRLHDLRHGAATLALAGGTDLKIVQELLGHSSITITADTYTSVLPDLTRMAVENAVRMVPRRSQEAGNQPLPPATATHSSNRP